MKSPLRAWLLVIMQRKVIRTRRIAWLRLTVHIDAIRLVSSENYELLETCERSLQKLNITVCEPHGGRQLSWNCHGRCPSVRT